MGLSVFWSIRDFAQAVVDLPAAGSLPTRTVLVPNARVAHALRRELLRMGQPAALAGTRFVGFAAAAAEVLQAVGTVFTAGEEALRVVRVRTVLGQRPKLKAFDLKLLTEKPGWDEALASAIGTLEDAGVRAGDLPASDVLGDVRTVWERVEAAAGSSWTRARILREAAAVLRTKPDGCPFEGAVAPATGHESAVQAAFVSALPAIVLGLIAARPVRESHLARIAALYGPDARGALEGAKAPVPGPKASERDILATFFFEEPARLAQAGRARSTGHDGSLELEEHAGLEAEIEAAVQWVAREVFEHGTPLEDIAVLVPSLHPQGAMMAERIRRLSRADGSALPVFVAGGLPLESTAAGARALAVVTALREHLPAERVAALLPALRKVDDEVQRLSPSDGISVAYSLGTLGGNPAAPKGALSWSARAAARAGQLAAVVAEAEAAAADPSQVALARAGKDAARALARLRAVQPALDALVGVAALVLGNRPLSEIWEALRRFLGDYVPSPGPGIPVHQLLDPALRRFCDDSACGSLTGQDALAVVEDVVHSRRAPAGRFGEPAVYVGTVAGAAGLPFTAVRVIGLSEGRLPAVPREDPVLPEPNVLRAALPGALLADASDQVLGQLHALDRSVRSATARVALSAPRRDLQRSDREPSSLFIEAAAAVARPTTTGAPVAIVPDTNALRRDYFGIARLESARARGERPLTPSAWQMRATLAPGPLPASWKAASCLDLKRIRNLRDQPPDAARGVLGTAGALPAFPGLSADRPISASRLRVLLDCPHRFLMETIFGWTEPASAPTTGEIETLEYGSLFHAIAERFSREHGVDFNARKRSPAEWRKVAKQIAGEELDRLFERYPLAGDAVKAQQRAILLQQVDDFITYDWNEGSPRTFVGVEVPFGYADPMSIKVGRSKLFVRGFIDRLDKESGRTLVRDLKTGSAHPRSGGEEGATPQLDVQIGLYGLVAGELADSLRLPAKVGAAYSYVDRRGMDERSFRDDFDGLATEVAKWLRVAHAMLSEHSFPPAPIKDSCSFCGFRVLCTDSPADSLAFLEGRTGALGAFRELVAPTEDEGEEVDA